MALRFQSKGRGRIKGTAFFLIAAVCLGCLPLWRGTPSRERVLGERDGYRVTAGAPEPAGIRRVFSRRDLLQGMMLEVSPEHPLPADYPIPNTRAVRRMVGAYLPALEDVALRREAVYSLCEMQVDYPLETGVTLSLGTLSPAQQEDWRREAFSRCLAVYPLSEALNRAQAAVPGGNESEHQTGYALDIELTGALRVSQADPLLRNDTGEWLRENMWRYGWIYRYGPGTRAEGACEHVHLRFVDRVHAAALHALDLEFEEYLAMLHGQEALTIARDGQDWAYVYALPCQDALEFQVPAESACQASLDNLGYAILTVAAQGTF